MDFLLINTYGNYIDAHIAMGVLEQHGITCWLKDENTVTVNPVLANAVGGIKLMAEAGKAEEAIKILRELGNQTRVIHACPRCGSINVEFVTTPRKASNFFGTLIGFLSMGSALPTDQVWHCFDCGNEYTVKENSQ